MGWELRPRGRDTVIVAIILSPVFLAAGVLTLFPVFIPHGWKGWLLAYLVGATPAIMASLLARIAKQGACQSWITRRHPENGPRPPKFRQACSVLRQCPSSSSRARRGRSGSGRPWHAGCSAEVSCPVRDCRRR